MMWVMPNIVFWVSLSSFLVGKAAQQEAMPAAAAATE